MSDMRFHRLEKYRTGGTPDRMNLSIPIPKTPSGKVNRSCPAPSCMPALFQFGGTPPERSIASEHASLIRRQPNTAGTTCPYCGHDDQDSAFNSQEDMEDAKRLVSWAARQDVADAFRNMFRNTFRGSRHITFKPSYSSTAPAPVFVREDLLRNLACDICGREYGVYAAALFCPDCGARNIHVHLRRELELIIQQLDIAEGFEQDGSKELSFRLLGNAHEDVLSLIETYHKVVYRFIVRKRLPVDEAEKLCSKKVIGNSFQNIARGRQLYDKFAFDPYAALSEDDLEFLRINFEKRHVFGHNLGMVDETYAELSKRDRPGQTVPILAEEISRFAELCSAVIIRLEEESPEFLPPASR